MTALALGPTALLATLLLAGPATAAPDPHPPTPASPTSAPWSSPGGVEILSDDTHYTVRLDPTEGGHLVEFLRLSQALLGLPIKYTPAEVSDVRLRVTGDLSCAHEDYASLFQTVLRSYSFLVTTRHYDGGSYLEVSRMTSGGPVGRFIDVRTVLLDRADLGSTPQALMPVYTVVFPIEHADARAVMAALQGYLDATIESARNVDEHAVIVTARIESLRFMDGLVAALDRTAERRGSRLQDLQQQIETLEARLEQLDAIRPAGPDGER